MSTRRIINIIRKGHGISDTDLPAFLTDMSQVPDIAKGRCVIAVTNLSHVRSVIQSQEASLNDTLILNVSAGDHRVLDRVNQETWTDPVVIIGSLHSLAYETAIKRIGKIAFYGGAALLPPHHDLRKMIEDKLYQP